MGCVDTDVDDVLKRFGGCVSSVSRSVVGKTRAKGKGWKRGRGRRTADVVNDGERRLGSSRSVECVFCVV